MDVLEVGSSQFSLSLLRLLPDQEKVVNHPQAENSHVNIVLKIARIATKDEQKYVYDILVWQDGILTYWLPILNSLSCTLNFEF